VIVSGQLLPPAELDHPLPEHLTIGERIAVYCDLLEASEQMLIAGLEATLPAGSDIREAVREVYERQSAEHVASLERIAERINRLEAEHGRAGRSPDA
jgi:hypothetical protein